MVELADRDAGSHGRDAGSPAVADEVAATRREELAQRPEHLRAAVATLRAALGDPSGDDPERRERLVAALTEASDRIAAHNEEAEGPDGLLGQVVQDAAWLAPRVHTVAQEHDRLLADCERLCTAETASAPRVDLERIVDTMAVRIEEHRHHGTELLMDAYGLDVSAGD
jgi:hypothetical protein